MRKDPPVTYENMGTPERTERMPSNLRAPDFAVDESQRGAARFVSAALKERHIAELMAENYDSHIGATAASNFLLANFFKYLTTANPHTETLASRSKTWRVIEFVLVLLLRVYWPQMLHFLSICLSLIAFKCRVPTQFWTILTTLGVLYSYEFTSALALELGKRLTPSGPGDVPDGAIAGIYCFDNNEIFRRKNAQHAADGRTNDMLKMNNIYLYKDSYATELEIPLVRGECAARPVARRVAAAWCERRVRLVRCVDGVHRYTYASASASIAPK